MAVICNSCFWMVKFLKSSPLKLLAKINWNLVNIIYTRSSIAITHLVLIHLMHGCQRQFLLLSGHFLKIFSSKSACPNALQFGRRHLRKVFSKDCSFHSDPCTNMAITGNSCFWLVDFWKTIFSSKTASPNEMKLGRQHV